MALGLLVVAAAGARADLSCGKILARAPVDALPDAGSWVAGGLRSGLADLIRSARQPGNLREDAAVFSLAARAWARPRFERRGVDALETRLVFDERDLMRTLNERGATILVHTHPGGLHDLNAARLGVPPSGPEDDYLHILNSLPSFTDVVLARTLARRGGGRQPGFWIVSPRYVVSVRTLPGRDHAEATHDAVFRDLVRQLPEVRERGQSFAAENVIAMVNRRWRATRLRLVGVLVP